MFTYSATEICGRVDHCRYMEMAVKTVAMEEEAKRGGGSRRCGAGGSSYAGRPQEVCHP